MVFIIGISTETPAALSFTSQSYSFDINENSANGTLLGQVSDTGGAYTYTLQLDVGTQEVSNWSTRDEDFRTCQQNPNTTSFETILETSLQIGGDSSVTSIDIVSGSEVVGWLAISSAVNGFWGDMPFEVTITDETITDLIGENHMPMETYIQPTVIRNNRGLSIQGTRIILY